MITSHKMIHRMVLSAWATTLLAAGTVHAQSAAPVQFDIDAQDLGGALKAFGLQSGRDVMFSPASVSQLKTAGIHGTLDTTAALQALLAGTGLVHEITSNAVIVVRGPHETIPAPAPTPALDEGQRAPETATKSKGSIAGTVTDSVTTRVMRGAQVRLQETGLIAVTNEAGAFHFPDVAPGTYTLVVSAIGFPNTIWDVDVGADENVQGDYVLEPGMETVTVFGTRSSRATALNQQRSAENSSFVISSDTLGNFPGTTISEALRRVPGVAFQRDKNTGDGTNIILRGLAPDMNAVKLNGLLIAVADGRSRSANLGNLLAASVDKITVHHSLLPSMDSAGSGGLVEVETKSPLQRDARYANFGVEYGRTGGNFSDDILGNGTISGIFGDEANFGLSAAVQYRRRSIENIQYDTGLVYGRYLPLERDGSTGITDIGDIDPRTPFPFVPGVDQAYSNGIGTEFGHLEDSTLGVVLSGEWQIADHTSLRLDLQRARARNTNFRRSSNVYLSSSYEELPVAALGGEVRQTLAWDGFAFAQQTYTLDSNDDVTDTYSFRGDSNYGQWQHHYAVGYASGTSKPRSIRMDVGFPIDSVLDPSFISPAAVDPQEGRIISVFGPRTGSGLPLPLLSDAGWAYFNDSNNYFLQNGFKDDSTGSNKSYTGEWNTRYSFDSPHVNYLEVGATYVAAKFKRQPTSFASVGFCPETGECVGPFEEGYVDQPVGAFGLGFDDSSLGPIGVRGQGFQALSRGDTEAFFRGFAQSPRVRIDEIPSTAQQRTSTHEDNLATYLQGSLKFGKLEVVGGFRMNRIAVDAFNLNTPGFIDATGTEDLEFQAAFARILHESATTTDVLPRVQLNYRQTDNLIFRGSYTLAVARPTVGDLSATSTVSLDLQDNYGPTLDRPQLFIDRGNPALEPALTHSFDLGVEYYNNEIGLIRLNAFYKHIDNLLELNQRADNPDALIGLPLPDHEHFRNLPADLYVLDSMPVNTPFAARIWGIETHVERQFTFLPGYWSGFGMFGNVTYTKSSHTQTVNWFSSPVFGPDGELQGRTQTVLFIGGVPFEQQPKYSGTLALTYNAYSIDASLSYSGQDRRTSTFSDHGLVHSSAPDSSLDFRFEYALGARDGAYHVFFECADMLKGTHDPSVLSTVGDGSTPTYYTGGSYLGGRQFRVGMNATF